MEIQMAPKMTNMMDLTIFWKNRKYGEIEPAEIYKKGPKNSNIE